MYQFIQRNKTNKVSRYWNRFLQSYTKSLQNQPNQSGEQQLIEEWTGMKIGPILFNIDINHWSVYLSDFNKNLLGKQHLLFLIEDNKNEKFGYYFDSQFLFNKKEWNKITDKNSFHFNLQSNERLSNSMKFEINENYEGRNLIEEKPDNYYDLIQIGDILLKKEEMRKYCFVDQHEYHFNYHQIQNALNGKNGKENYFYLKRLIVIQMV